MKSILLILSLTALVQSRELIKLRRSRLRSDSTTDDEIKKLQRGLRDVEKVAKRIQSLADHIPPLENERARNFLYNANEQLFTASDILRYELLAILQQSHWWKTSNRDAQMKELERINRQFSHLKLKIPHLPKVKDPYTANREWQTAEKYPNLQHKIRNLSLRRRRKYPSAP